jgi:5-methyltetrahydrofolate--homocysteine methyltransferase
MEEYEELRDHYASLFLPWPLTPEQAIKKAIDFVASPPAPKASPTAGGRPVVRRPLEDVGAFIDWNSFQTWELRGRYPNRGYPRSMMRRAMRPRSFLTMLSDYDERVASKTLTPHKASWASIPANTVGSEDGIYTGMRAGGNARFCMFPAAG